MDRDKVTELASRRNTYIYTILWSFVSGVLISSFVRITPIFSVFLILISIAIFGIEKISKKAISHETLLIILALVCLGLGSLRYAVKDFHTSALPSREGMVASEPEHRDADTRFVYQPDTGEKALVSTDMYSHVEYGEAVSVSCKFSEPGVIDEGGGREFNYAEYLAKDDIYYTCNYAKITLLAEPQSSAHATTQGRGRSIAVRLVSTLLKIKSGFVGKMKAILPEPESSLLAGLIVAGKDALPKSVLQDFQNAGVIHIVVLSGYNITIVAEFFLIILGFFSISLRKRAVFSALGIALFVLMAGASASIVRAALMAMVVLLGKIIRRPYSPPRTLLLAGTLMLVWNPKLLVFDPSFQLTFLAMLALIYVQPIVEHWFAKMTWPTPGQASGQSRPLPSWLTALLATTIATQVTVLPYLLYSVGSVSLVSLASNVLILGFVPLTMLIGFLATLVAFVSSYIAWPLSFISHLLLAWILGVAHDLGNLPFADIKISHFSGWLMIACYVLFVVIIFARKKVQQLVSHL